ncbi:ABC transporter permease [Ruminiclostridium herbifermentans]|uniref:ABC transporter permease n=1 Tax=Ruminiclostridium herbifermentans TaxID=2488810 RepID=A0A4U7JJM8_9FIRM|nr:ABC transporter permease [Ruminiclostridium herbifermentans]QNU66143.1 ABC transporter permease [Ruminiclostridium herbifermentans]
MIKKIMRSLWLGIVLLFIYLPILILAGYSFLDTPTIGASGSFTLQNYVKLFTTPELLDMISGTLSLAFQCAVISTILGTLGAIGAFYSKKGMRNFIVTANQIPIVNADVVTGFSLCILLIVVLGMDKDTFIPLIAGHVVLTSPFVYLSVVPKLKQMDYSLYEAALDLGASARQALFRIVMPQIIPGIISGFLLSVTLSMDDYFITSYTKPATFNTISTYVVNATRGSNTEVKTALWALSTLIFAIILLVVLISNITANRKAGEKNDTNEI